MISVERLRSTDFHVHGHRAPAMRYPQYRDRPFDRVLVLRIVGLTGWAAGAS